jgi:prepilin-type N-terminal cleavage/methylation domain-containing protein
MTTRSRLRQGFTLIELMFSMVIGSIVLILSAALLGTSGDSYDRVQGCVASEREARALISQLSADLSGGLYHQEAVIEDAHKEWPADRLGFLSLQPSETQTGHGRVGDLCAVNYYLKDLTVGRKTTRCLMRGFRESRETFEALRNHAVRPLFSEDPQIDEPVAFGVVAFEARPKCRDRDGKWIEWTKDTAPQPEAYGVRLIVARRKLSAKLKKSADWDGARAAVNGLGKAADASRNQDLEVYEATIRLGSHAKL